MTTETIGQRISKLHADLPGADSDLARFIDPMPCPAPFHGSGEIKLIILGQDPTVKNPESRAKIKTVLNLDREGEPWKDYYL